MSSEFKERAANAISGASAALVGISHQIHSHPELAFDEIFACRVVAEALEQAGYDLEVGGYGLPTSVEAIGGDGILQIVVCAEYDALPALGHACGHNIIAASAVGAAIGLKDLLDEIGVRLRVLGTPGEEGGGGKVLMLEAGAFQGAHAALMVHPGPVDLPYMPSLATTRLAVTYSGRAAHASAFPERGINAADAATLAQTAIAMARQQLPPGTRVHGIVVEAGVAPNVIPEVAKLDYLIRASGKDSLYELEYRVRNCFEAAAIATGCTVEIRRSMPVYDAFKADERLTILYQENAEALGRRFSEVTQRVLRAAGSTDMGNVSALVPSIHPMIGLGREAGTIHGHEFAAAARSANGDRAVLDGATALAHTIIDMATDPAVRGSLLAGT